MEFIHGRPLSPEELEQLREQIEHEFDEIKAVSPRSTASSAATDPNCPRSSSRHL